MVRILSIAAPALLVAACSQEQPPLAEETDAASPATVEAASEPDPSRYTSLADCDLVRSAPEEAGFFEYECLGEGGYRLRKVQSDLRDNIVVLAPGGGEADLGLPALANGAFSSVGETAEWHDDLAEGPFAPRALIVRQSVMEDPDPAVPEVSYLVVAKLGEAPCVVARIAPAPDQNERAREAAASDTECMSRAE
jgi:hypothetical protein